MQGVWYVLRFLHCENTIFRQEIMFDIPLLHIATLWYFIINKKIFALKKKSIKYAFTKKKKKYKYLVAL